MGFFLIGLPIVAVLLFILVRNHKIQHIISLLTSSLMVIMAMYLTKEITRLGSIHYIALNDIFYVDALSIIVLDIVVAIGFLVSIYSVGYMETEVRHGKIDANRLRLYYILMYSFLFTMLLALTVKNMGIMWIAIEATTLASAFLVGFYNDKHSIEAAWKYVIICSVGIAIALLGIIFLHLSSIGVLESRQFLDWTALYDKAEYLKSPIVKLAFIFILIGFGTKAGLAPMHTWLPDAHSQAPSPISALLSGVLLNSAMYGIIRSVAIVNKNLGSSVYAGRLLIVIGILSILTAAIFILTQKDYKRLLAYSSIEHMGIIAVAIGLFTPLSVFGAVLHMINHSFTKSMLFLASGNILQKYNTKHIAKIKGVLKVMPITGSIFLLGLFAIAGTPPFSIFASELSIIMALFNAESFFVGSILILLLAIIFTGIAVTLFKIFYGNPKEEGLPKGETNIAGTVGMVLLFTVIAISGLLIPDGIKELITQAQNVIMGA